MRPMQLLVYEVMHHLDTSALWYMVRAVEVIKVNSVPANNGRTKGDD